MKLELDEIVKATKNVPWDYEIYNIIVNKQEVGRIVYRLGTNQQLCYCGHIGYTIDKEYRGYGYARMAMSLLFDILKNRNIHEVILSCEKDNIASLKTIEHFCILDKKYIQNVPDDEYENLYIYLLEVK